MFAMGCVLGILVGLLIGDLEYRAHKRRNYEHFRQLAAQGFFKEIASKNCYEHLAQKLEIEADGGDNPAEFVEWAVTECWKDADHGRVRFAR